MLLIILTDMQALTSITDQTEQIWKALDLQLVPDAELMDSCTLFLTVPLWESNGNNCKDMLWRELMHCYEKCMKKENSLT